MLADTKKREELSEFSIREITRYVIDRKNEFKEDYLFKTFIESTIANRAVKTHLREYRTLRKQVYDRLKGVDDQMYVAGSSQSE